MARKPTLDAQFDELHKRVIHSEMKLDEYISGQRKRDTSIFIAVLTAVISAVVKALFAV